MRATLHRIIRSGVSSPFLRQPLRAGSKTSIHNHKDAVNGLEEFVSVRPEALHAFAQGIMEQANAAAGASCLMKLNR